VLTIQSFGSAAQLLQKKITSVTMLGSNSKLQWEQRPDGLRITCPREMPVKFAVAFKVVM
jgi:alpha-L-fucosidase